MKVIWNEPLGLVAKCPKCMDEIELHYDRRALQLDGVHNRRKGDKKDAA